MKILQALKEVGLSEAEAEVYLALVRSSSAQPASIIANKINVNRTTTYKILTNLTKKKLVTKTIRHGIICFYAEDPEETLKNLIESREEKLSKANEIILNTIPPMIMGEEISANLPKIRYYEGADGIKQIYELVLKEGVDYYRYGDISKIYGTLGDYTDEFIAKRTKLGITAHAIMPYHKQDEEEEGGAMKKNMQELRKALYIPHEFFPIEGEVRIFGNKVAILSLRKESPIGVVIESDTVSHMFKSIFMLTWKDYTKKAFKLLKEEE